VYGNCGPDFPFNRCSATRRTCSKSRRRFYASERFLRDSIDGVYEFGAVLGRATRLGTRHRRRTRDLLNRRWLPNLVVLFRASKKNYLLSIKINWKRKAMNNPLRRLLGAAGVARQSDRLLFQKSILLNKPRGIFRRKTSRSPFKARFHQACAPRIFKNAAFTLSASLGIYDHGAQNKQ